MTNLIESILIVGGGTAGWLSALFLGQALNRNGAKCAVTLVESAEIGTVGVGESTVPTLRETLATLGLDEQEWLISANGTFKMAVKFIGWSRPPAPDTYWHPFTPAIPSPYGVPLSHFWLGRRLQGHDAPLDRSCFSAVRLCEEHRSPKSAESPAYAGAVNYAYHVDAGLLAAYLRSKALKAGVRHIVDTVQSAARASDGGIRSVTTAEHGEVEADLFIDCTGFRGLLINRTLEEPFIPYSDALLCDSAVVMPVPHFTADGVPSFRPYTTATAASAGWIWDIPVYSRRGIGYVYCSAFCSREQAEEELCRYAGGMLDGQQPRHMKMRVGRTRNAWVKNCVSIGLSTGFVEPLEATGIYLIEMGLKYLWTYLPDRTLQPWLIDQYNRTMAGLYEHVRDFLVLHYQISRRDDTPFWHTITHDCALPDTLKHRLESWRHVLPRHEEMDQPGLFGAYSYASILAGVGVLPDQGLPVLEYGYSVDAEAEFAAIARHAEEMLDYLPDHYRYVRQVRSKAAIQRMGP